VYAYNPEHSLDPLGKGALNVKRELWAWSCHGHVYLLAQEKWAKTNLCIMKNEAASCWLVKHR